MACEKKIHLTAVAKAKIPLRLFFFSPSALYFTTSSGITLDGGNNLSCNDNTYVNVEIFFCHHVKFLISFCFATLQIEKISNTKTTTEFTYSIIFSTSIDNNPSFSVDHIVFLKHTHSLNQHNEILTFILFSKFFDDKTYVNK